MRFSPPPRFRAKESELARREEALAATEARAAAASAASSGQSEELQAQKAELLRLLQEKGRSLEGLAAHQVGSEGGDSDSG